MGAAALRLEVKLVRTSLAVPVVLPLDEDVQRAGAGPKIVLLILDSTTERGK